MSKKLSTKQIQFLKGLAHKLDAVATLGKAGVTQEFLANVSQCLDARELIKVKFHSEDREEFRTALEATCLKLEAHMVQAIGRIGVIYKPSKKKKIQLPPA